MSLLQTAYLVARTVPTPAQLQAAIDALGFDCKVDTYYEPFRSSGFLPCTLNGSKSGFEIYFDTASKVAGLVPSLGSRDTAITFRWGGDMAECGCVLIVSAALAKSFAAIVHYQDDNLLYSADQLVQEARSAMESI